MSFVCKIGSRWCSGCSRLFWYQSSGLCGSGSGSGFRTGSGFILPAIINGHFTKEWTREGAVSGMIVGMLFMLYYMLKYKFGILMETRMRWMVWKKPGGLASHLKDLVPLPCWLILLLPWLSANSLLHRRKLFSTLLKTSGFQEVLAPLTRIDFKSQSHIYNNSGSVALITSATEPPKWIIWNERKILSNLFVIAYLGTTLLLRLIVEPQLKGYWAISLFLEFLACCFYGRWWKPHHYPHYSGTGSIRKTHWQQNESDFLKL